MEFLFPTVHIAPARCGTQACPRPRASRPQVHPLLSLINELSQPQPSTRSHTHHHPRRPYNPRFDVAENTDSYHVEGEVPGLEQSNISVEFPDGQTLVVKGQVGGETAKPNTAPAPAPAPAAPVEDKAEEEQTEAQHAETGSVKSYQPTVEDDFEDLGNDAASASSNTVDAAPAAAEKSSSVKAGKAPVEGNQVEQPQTRRWVAERSYGSFSRTFRFPAKVDTENVRASLRNGILAIHVPKAPVPEVKRVRIE